MLFNSNQFLFFFLPLTVVLFWLLVRRSAPAAIGFLALVSYVFYVYGEPVYPWLLAASILFNYLCGLAIRRSREPYSRAFLLAGLIGDLAVLGLFKYTNFFLAQLGLFVRVPQHVPIALPIGISFYTFTQIAYLVDTYREHDSESNFVRYFLFISYFPHLIAGPILHHKEMMPQFLRPRVRTPMVSLYPGLCLFAIGLAKKVMLADPCGLIASSVFGPAAHGIRIGFIDSWVAALFYTVQIYFDFSGYTDMALGISLMLGIRLPLNFNSPYKARNIIDFWRRWHITLSRFLRDYLYFTLGGNRKGPRRRYVNLLLTMVIGGLWHGAGWGFLLWGALHGAALALNHLWHDSARNRRFHIPSRLSWVLTFLFVAAAWVPFRAASFRASLNLWQGMAGLHGLIVPDEPVLRTLAAHLHLAIHPNFYSMHEFPVFALALLLVLFAPNSQQIMRRFRVGLDSPGYRALPASTSRLEARIDLPTAIAVGALLAFAARSIGSYSEFIYFHF